MNKIVYLILLITIIFNTSCQKDRNNDLSDIRTSDNIREIVTNFYSVSQDGYTYFKEFLISKDSLALDTSGIEINTTYFDFDGLSHIDVFLYDEKGRRTGSERHNPDNKSLQYSKYYYNEEGVRIKMEVFEAITDRKLSTTLLEYDENGNRIKSQFLNNNNEIVSTFEFEYDEKGNEIAQLLYNKQNQLTQRKDYKYTKFNEKGQWLEKLGLEKDVVNSIHERIFRYY